MTESVDEAHSPSLDDDQEDLDLEDLNSALTSDQRHLIIVERIETNSRLLTEIHADLRRIESGLGTITKDFTSTAINLLWAILITLLVYVVHKW
jgi:hypothetical protein